MIHVMMLPGAQKLILVPELNLLLLLLCNLLVLLWSARLNGLLVHLPVAAKLGMIAANTNVIAEFVFLQTMKLLMPMMDKE